MKLAILGAGSIGSAVACHAARLGHEVLLWCRREEQAGLITKARRNPGYLEGMPMPEGITATADISSVMAFSRDIISAVPTQSFRSVIGKLRETASGNKRSALRILNLAKGIEIESGKFLHEAAADEWPESRYSILSGPSHAEEVANGLPTAVVVASENDADSKFWQAHLNSGSFRVYTSDDVKGVEVGGAMKNIIAISAGVARSMKFGDNAVAALATRGLAEIVRYGVSCGANPHTFSGLAGVGDLMVTCYSMHSRNHRFGIAIGDGLDAEKAFSIIGQVVEGAFTAKALAPRARALDIELPVTDGIYRIVYEGAKVEEVLMDILLRVPKAEIQF